MSREYCIFVLVASFVPGFLACSMTPQDADNCGHKSMFFGNREAVVPTNDAQMLEHCDHIRNGIKCLQDYADNCIQGFAQQISQTILKNAGAHSEKRCNDPSKREEFVKHIKCLDSKEKKEPLDMCSDKHIVMMEKIKDMGDEDRLRASCCSFHKIRECVVQKSKAICGAETSDYWDDLIEEAADESLEFACAEYNSLEKCDKHMPDNVWQPLKDIADSDDASVSAIRHKYKSIISVIIEMMEKSTKSG